MKFPGERPNKDQPSEERIDFAARAGGTAEQQPDTSEELERTYRQAITDDPAFAAEFYRLLDIIKLQEQHPRPEHKENARKAREDILNAYRGHLRASRKAA